MEFHFIITAANPTGAVGTFSGVWTATQGESRMALYEAIVKIVIQKMGGNPNILFFSLEPNELSAA